MIIFNNLSSEAPYILFKEKYDKALNAGQKNIEAVSISSYNKCLREVDSRYVNLKFIDNKKFIFFSNYNSPKSIAFESHNQVTSLFYWSSTNVQIRIKAKIKKSDESFSDLHFSKRGDNKNALAISSQQSEYINSYEKIIDNYNNTLNDKNLLASRPSYWGGYTFIPYYFEFWEGHDFRLNKREVFSIKDGKWEQYIIQP